MSLNISKSDLQTLTVDERLQLLEDLWESLRADSDSVPVPNWHRQLLDQRLADAEAHPDDIEPWDVVRARIERRFEK